MSDDIILAVVGSTKFTKDAKASEAAEKLILQHYQELRPRMVVSGGAEGIDSMAVGIAKGLHIDTHEFLPKNPRWEPHGYKERNVAIAEACTHLLCIRHYATRTYGSGWTADRAEALDREVVRYLYNHAQFMQRVARYRFK